LVLFFMDANAIPSWRDHSIFSPTLISISSLLISSAIVGMAMSFFVPSIEFAFKGKILK